MDQLPREFFNPEQNTIIDKRAAGATYSQICNDLSQMTGVSYYNRHISLCLYRSALGLPWKLGEERGSYPYLCPKDLQTLRDKVHSASENECAMDPLEVIDEAYKLKGERFAYGLDFLTQVKCPELKSQLSQEALQPPSRQWINCILDDLEAVIKNRRYVDPKRLEACSYHVIDSFFTSFGAKIQSYSKFLLFGADETMVSTKTKTKAVAPSSVQLVIERAFPDMPHISAMMCHNVVGKILPPFYILTDLKKLPDELAQLVTCGEIWVASTSSGYMTRDLFLLWVFNFINWLSHYRIVLGKGCYDLPALLLMDGHSSRECPLALMLLRRAHVDVIILPSHVSHVLQMFDVAIAAPLKLFFATKFKKALKEVASNPDLNSETAKFRLAAIQTCTGAWKAAATPATCEASAAATGVYPLDPTAVHKSPFVRNLNPAEQRRFEERERRNSGRFSISNKLITDAEFLVSMSQHMLLKTYWKHLCNLEKYNNVPYHQIVQEFLHNPMNEAYLLSPLPPYFLQNAPPLYFN